MAPVPLLPIHDECWTVDDLDGLPDDGLRYELVDGALLVSPPPPNRHNAAANELGFLLHAVLDTSWQIVTPGSIQFDARNVREPDLLVVRREGLGADFARPADVLLAVEIMSPSSIANDRLAKPAQYAAAGIAHYWRLERQAEPVLITHELAHDVYRETGRFTAEVVITDPVALRFSLRALLA